MFTKNAFKQFVKQCLAEVIVEDGAVRKNAMFDKDKKCTHPNGFQYSGKAPNTGHEICSMCGERKPSTKKQVPRLGMFESEPPQEQWKDTFGNKMSGEMVVAENGQSLELTPTGHDDEWSRPVYKDSDGKIYVDVNCGSGTPSIHSTSDEGEPEFPVKNFTIKKVDQSKSGPTSPTKLTSSGKSDKYDRPIYTDDSGKTYLDVHQGKAERPLLIALDANGDFEGSYLPSDGYKIQEAGLTSETAEDPKEAQYVEYVGQMPSEKPFMLRTPEGNAKFEYVKAKYPDGKVDIAVYAFRGDMVYGYSFFRKMMGIQESKKSKTVSFIKECVLEVLKENLSEGFDPQSMAGPNGPDETGGNPYAKWNSDMRKLEEDGDGFNSVKGENPAATMKAQMFPYADQNDAMRQLETASPSQAKTFQEIRNELDPDGTKHDLTLHCVKCGTTETCRCSKPKRKVDGVCDECSK